MSNEREFHESRRAFAFIGDELCYIENDARGHAQWLLEEFGIDDVAFEDVIRGYAKGNTVYTYQGSNFETNDEVEEVVRVNIEVLANLLPNCSEVTFYTGVVIGEVGEIWKPVNKLLTYIR